MIRSPTVSETHSNMIKDLNNKIADKQDEIESTQRNLNNQEQQRSNTFQKMFQDSFKGFVEQARGDEYDHIMHLYKEVDAAEEAVKVQKRKILQTALMQYIENKRKIPGFESLFPELDPKKHIDGSPLDADEMQGSYPRLSVFRADATDKTAMFNNMDGEIKSVIEEFDDTIKDLRNQLPDLKKQLGDMNKERDDFFDAFRRQKLDGSMEATHQKTLSDLDKQIEQAKSDAEKVRASIQSNEDIHNLATVELGITKKNRKDAIARIKKRNRGEKTETVEKFVKDCTSASVQCVDKKEMVKEVFIENTDSIARPYGRFGLQNQTIMES